MPIVISGLGTALPVGALTQHDAARTAHALRRTDHPDDAKREQLLAALYRRSGVEKRHSVLLRVGDESAAERQTFYEATSSREDRGPSTAARMACYEQAAPQLAEAAAREALSRSSTSPQSISHLVTVSCSGFSAPGFDLQLFDQLSLSGNTTRTHLGFMGCHGALNGLRVARALASADTEGKVLLCAVELCTLHHQYTDDPQEIVANSLFADGAAAAVVEFQADARPRSDHADQPNPVHKPWKVLDQASVLLPATREMMSWRVADHGFRMTLSPQVPEVIQRELNPWLSGWLQQHDLAIHDIQRWAVHPGGPRILNATADALGLATERLDVSRSVLRECGNMSSPTILFILDRLQRTGDEGPCVALAFGPGLVVEAALLA